MVVWRRSRRGTSVVEADPEPTPPTGDVREVFGADGEMGTLVIQLLRDLEVLRIQVADYTFPESEAELERLEAANILISCAYAFVVLGLDQLLADDANPFGPETLGWLRTVRKWSGVGPALGEEDIEAAFEIVRRLGPSNSARSDV
jgi:hypothetical protein